MPETLACDLRMDTGCKQVGRVRVAQIVKPNAGQGRVPGQEANPLLAERASG